jgi:hypothetical protein
VILPSLCCLGDKRTQTEVKASSEEPLSRMVEVMRVVLQSVVAVKPITNRGQSRRNLVRIGLNIDPPTEEVFERRIPLDKIAEPRSLFDLLRRGCASASIVMIMLETQRVGHVCMCQNGLPPGATIFLL